MNTDLLFLVLVGSVVGAASGYLGSFMVVKRMSLVGDALSHVALPGIAIALSIGINPMLGAFVALMLAVLGIWYLEKKSEIYPEALVGIFFTASLSIGILITPEPELLEALFGSIENISAVDGLIVVLASMLIFLLTSLIAKRLLLGVVSEDLAVSGGINLSKTNLTYLFLVGLVVALGVKFLGTLLTGALVIIPAVTAKNIAGSIKSFHLYSIIFGILSVAIGILLSSLISIPSGPAVVLVSVSLFIVSHFVKRNN